MDLMEHIARIAQAKRDQSFADSPQLILGDLIDELEKCDLSDLSSGEKKGIAFDFGSAIPTTVDSWRGSYAELAIGYRLSGYDNDDQHFSDSYAVDFLEHLKSTIGKTFDGWKGGEYTMSKSTPVWVSNPGNAGSTAVVGVLDAGWQIVIITAYCEY